MSISNLFFEDLQVKTLDLHYSQKEAFEIVSKKVMLTKKVPTILRKQYPRDFSKPYFTGVVNYEKNKIELLYNPTTNKFIRVSANIEKINQNASKLTYTLIQGGELMSGFRMLICLYALIFGAWNYVNNTIMLLSMLGITAFIIGLRFLEMHKILLNKTISPQVKFILFPNIGLITICFILLGVMVISFCNTGKFSWQIIVVIGIFIMAFHFLRKLNGIVYIEEKFLELFR